MTVKHDIDDKSMLITTTLSGDAIDSELVDQLTTYLRDIKSQPDYIRYNEILDLREIKGLKIDAHGIRNLARISTEYDPQDVRTKLAIIASSILAFGFAKIYEIARRISPKSHKQVHVFKNREDAISWIENDN